MSKLSEVWLEGLKAGDAVAVCGSGIMHKHMLLANVERITKTKIVAAGRNFRRSDGREMAALNSPRWLREPTPEVVARVVAMQNRRRLKDLAADSNRLISDKQVVAMLAAHEAAAE